MSAQHTLARFGLTALAACFVPALSAAPAATPVASGYSQPPKNILDVMRAPSPPAAYISPTREQMLLVSLQEYPSIARVATPFLRLGGVRIEPKNHSRHDTPGGYGINPCAATADLVTVADSSQRQIKLPEGCATGPAWSADGKRFVFENVTADTVELWVGDGKTGAIHGLDHVHGRRSHERRDEDLLSHALETHFGADRDMIPTVAHRERHGAPRGAGC